MKKRENNYAFVDSQNVNLAIQDQGWKLNWRRFRVYLSEKYGVTKAYMFLGYLAKNKRLYRRLMNSGYTLVFKPVVQFDGDKVKGNVDAELVLQTMIDYTTYDQAVIITGDGDFYCLVKYLNQQNKLLRLLVPNKFRYSKLLRQVLPGNKLSFINDLKTLLQYKDPALRRGPVGGST